MQKPIESLIKQLPHEIVSEIFGFVFPLEKQIEFRKYDPSRWDVNYCDRYEIAYMNNSQLNQNCLLLSRIVKKNRKHRYYLTTQSIRYECSECGDEYNRYHRYQCNSQCLDMKSYKSRFCGKKLELALLEMYTTKKKA